MGGNPTVAATMGGINEIGRAVRCVAWYVASVMNAFAIERCAVLKLVAVGLGAVS